MSGGLSVVVAMHNQVHYVEQTLRSLRRVQHDDLDLVFVDDASDDGTTDLLERLVPQLDRAQLLSTGSVPVGVSAARNLGSAATRGRWLTYLDGDDFVAPDHWAGAQQAAERLDVDYLRTDHTRATGDHREIRRIPYGPRGVAADPRSGILPAHRSTSVDVPQPWTSLYHRRLYDRGLLQFDEGLRTCEDRHLTWRLHLQAESFAVVGLSGLYWRREVAGSLTAITDDRQLDFITAYDRIVALVLADSQAELLLPKAIRNYLAMTHHHLRRAEAYGRDRTAELIRRAHRSFAALPRDALAEVHAAQELDRQRALRPVLKGVL